MLINLRSAGATQGNAAVGTGSTSTSEVDAAATALHRGRRSSNPTVSVVVPTLNEARNLPYAFRRLPPCVTEVIVVDGRSIDDTIAVARALRPDVKIVLEPAKGKGAALRAGFAAATGEIIVMFDADGSADGGEIQKFVDVLVAGADYAKGSRYLPGGGSVDFTYTRKLGNLVLCAAANLACQSRFTDLCYGYNAFWRDCLDHVQVDVAGFEVETRLNMLVTRSGLSVVEVPSFEYGRVHGNSNLSVIRDGLRVVRTIATTTRDIMSGLVSVCAADEDVVDLTGAEGLLGVIDGRLNLNGSETERNRTVVADHAAPEHIEEMNLGVVALGTVAVIPA